jgi:hypothetical protein
MYTVFSIIGSLVLGFVLGMIHKQRVIDQNRSSSPTARVAVRR